MVLYPVNILSGIVLLFVSLLDTYLVLAGILLIGRKFAGGRAQFHHGIFCYFVEGPVILARRLLARWKDGPVPAWISWTTVIVAALMARTLLVGVISAMP